MSWVAYVDESMRQRRDGSGMYVLAAAVVEATSIPHVRDAAAALARGSRRFHWRDEEPPDRRKAVDMVAGLDAIHLVVVGVGLDSRRQERGRRLCLTRLLWELDQAGVGQVWLEARTRSLNDHDTAAISALRARKVIIAALRVDFVYPSEEPLAWLPDIVAGAVSAARGDGENRYLAPLIGLLSSHTIDLD